MPQERGKRDTDKTVKRFSEEAKPQNKNTKEKNQRQKQESSGKKKTVLLLRILEGGERSHVWGSWRKAGRNTK